MRLAILPLFATLLTAQQLQLNTVQPDGPAPSARIDGTIAHDPATNDIYLFGGEDTTARNDLWAYSIDSNRWRQLSPNGTKPDPRFGHTLNFDPIGRRLLLFGGQSTGFFSDIWAYDIASNQWSRLADTGAGPSRRYGHSAILDTARNRLVISHGFTDRGRFDDTWAFDLASNRWSDISPSDGRPIRRCLHHAVYDTAGDQMFLYGGCASGFGPCPLGDLWSFDFRKGMWKEVRPATVPPARQHYGIAFDDARRRLVLHGGSGAALFNDTWEFDPALQSWSQLNLPNPPAPRLRLQGVSTPTALYFFGGSKNGAKTADLLSLSPVRPSIVNAFSQARGPFAPGTLITIYGSNLPASLTVAGRPAPILFASPTQINARIPPETPLGRFPVLDISLPIVERAPGLFPIGFRTADIVVFFVTGANEDIPAATTMAVSGAPVELLYAGPAPGVPGVMQINARIPDRTSADVTLRIGSSEVTQKVDIQ
jgi:hypothetical protein